LPSFQNELLHIWEGEDHACYCVATLPLFVHRSGALNSLYWDRCGYKEPVQCTVSSR